MLNEEAINEMNQAIEKALSEEDAFLESVNQMMVACLQRIESLKTLRRRLNTFQNSLS
ncbi:MAG: hypothetical protein IMZ53_13120 [Thermoplasmata archaeon]|nr:hypothetical protein [Thermoplasmata archaeon]